MRKTLFVADLHLHVSETAKWQCFVNWITGLTKQAESQPDALYILGDLFRFFVGDDATSEMVIAIRQALSRLNAKVPVYFIRGNRDFLLGETFAAGCFKILPELASVNLYGRNTILTHGDNLCRKDIRYRIFRVVVQSRLARMAFRVLPVFLREFAANLVQRNFKHPDKIIVDYRWLSRQMDIKHASQAIYGHLHQYYIKDYNGRREICVPSWDEGAKWLVYNEDHSFSIAKT